MLLVELEVLELELELVVVLVVVVGVLVIFFLVKLPVRYFVSLLSLRVYSSKRLSTLYTRVDKVNKSVKRYEVRD